MSNRLVVECTQDAGRFRRGARYDISPKELQEVREEHGEVLRRVRSRHGEPPYQHAMVSDEFSTRR